MNVTSEERLRRIHMLDLKRQANLHQTALVNRDEEARRLKYRILSLRDENANLKDALAQRDAHIGSSAMQSNEVRSQLEIAKERARAQEWRIKKQDIEITNLKAEVEALNEAAQDSGKALQEKFALSRELNRLLPEMEHLQSQLLNHRAVIAEKQNLQRQLDTVEVELENEKRSKQRARDKDEADELGDLRSQVEEAERRVASEKREHEKTKKIHQKTLAVATGGSQQLEEQLAALTTELEATQNELHQVRTELERYHSEETAARPAPVRPAERGAEEAMRKKVTIGTQVSRKRGAAAATLTAQVPSDDESIERRPPRKRSAEQAGLGEKSNFSITPFLNRTKDISRPHRQNANRAGASKNDIQSQQSSRLADDAESEHETERTSEPEETENMEAAARLDVREAEATSSTPLPTPKAPTKAAASTKSQKVRERARAKSLKERTASKANTQTTAGMQGKKPGAGRRPDAKATDPGSDEENRAPALESGEMANPECADAKEQTAGPPRTATNSNPADTEAKKKRRRLLGGLGKNLFDEEEGGTPQQPFSRPMGPGRKMKTQLEGASNAFAGRAFSPLKRDRRGVHASFLM